MDISKFYIPKGFKLYGALGNSDPGLDDSTDNCFMLTKISSDSHIPIRVDMSFKIPEWWTKDMDLEMELRIIPVDKTLWYHYKRFRTGEWT